MKITIEVSRIEAAMLIEATRKASVNYGADAITLSDKIYLAVDAADAPMKMPEPVKCQDIVSRRIAIREASEQARKDTMQARRLKEQKRVAALAARLRKLA